VLDEPLEELSIGGQARRELVCAFLEVAARTPLLARESQSLPPFGLGRRPWIVISSKPAGLGVEEHCTGCAFGIRRGEEGGEATPLVSAP
jgi:hypothetical protein